MNINEQGLELENDDSSITIYENYLKTKYGSDFKILPESVFGNIGAANSRLVYDIEKQIVQLAAQFDPETATGIWQDALYERIGIIRYAPEKTVFSLKVHGIKNLACKALSISIKNKTNNKLFQNASDFTTDDNGDAVIDFECNSFGAVEITENDIFDIITAPDGIDSTSPADDWKISVGCDRESDQDFRERYRVSKSLNARSTQNALFSNLAQYVDNSSFLKIIDKNIDRNYDAGTLKIIVHHNTTDNIFAKAVFDSVAAGVELLGNTSVLVKNCEGDDTEIRFQNAAEFKVAIKTQIKIKDGYYKNSVYQAVKNSILDYVKTRAFGLGAAIYATEFTIPILSTEGVEAVLDLKIKENNSEDAYQDLLSLTLEQIPVFESDNIIINPET